MNALLESVAGPVLKFLLKSAGNIATLGILPLGDWAIDAWEVYRRRGTEAQLRAEIETIAQDNKKFREQVEVWLQENAGDQPEAVRRQAANYLNQMPGQIQRSLQRPDDPSGRTMPTSLKLSKPEDLKQFLPARMPRFQAGDRPFSGSDLIVQELVGTGGFGEVWRAIHEHRPNAAPVALKFCTDETAARSLIREVDLLDRVVSKGRHPGIVELKYAHLGSNPPCLEYEYVDGGDLAALILEIHARKKMTPQKAGELLLQLARSVGFAHRQSPPIVHRDLKPGNVLVRRGAESGIQLKVADFGIGSIASEQIIAEWSKSTPSSSMGATTRSACTPLYASPQQRRAGPPDPRDDVYALGVIWYQMLTGDVTREPPRGSSWRKKFAEQGMPQPLIELLDQCLEDDANDRPADAQVLAEKLAGLLSGKPTERARRPQPEEILPEAIPVDEPATPAGQETPNYLSVTCHGCGKKIKLSRRHAGKRVKCPQCGEICNAPTEPAPATPVNLGFPGLIHAALTTVIGFLLFAWVQFLPSMDRLDGRGLMTGFFLCALAMSSGALALGKVFTTNFRQGLTAAALVFFVSIGLAIALHSHITSIWLGLAVSGGIGLICGFLKNWAQSGSYRAAPAVALGVLLLAVPFFGGMGGSLNTTALAGTWQRADGRHAGQNDTLEITTGGTLLLTWGGTTSHGRWSADSNSTMRLIDQQGLVTTFHVDLTRSSELILTRSSGYGMDRIEGRWRQANTKDWKKDEKKEEPPSKPYK